MNSNDKNLKIDDDAKNRSILVTIAKESSRRSGIPRHKPHSVNAKDKSQLGNGADEKIGLAVPTVMTKRESSILGKKNPQIHESKRKAFTDKRCTEHFEKAVSQTVRKPSSSPRQESKYSRVLVASEKSTALDSCKRHSSLKSNKHTINHDPKDETSKKTKYKTNRKKSLPKAKEAPCTIILPSVERNTRREFKYSDSERRRGISARSTTKETEKVNKKQGIHDIKKCSDKVEINKIIKPVSKQIKNNVDNLGDVEETKKSDPQAIVKVKRTQDKETIRNCNYIDANATRSGAARTRIFVRKERTQVDNNPIDLKDGIDKRFDGIFENEASTARPPPVQKEINDKQESKTEQISIDTCNIRGEKIISLCHGGLKASASRSDCNQSQESGETFIKCGEKGENINLNSAQSNGTSCEQKFFKNFEIESSKANVATFSKYMEVCSDQNTEDVIDDSAKRLGNEFNEIKESQTFTKMLQSDLRDKGTQPTLLLNDEHHSGQKSGKGSNEQPIKKYLERTTLNLSSVDKSQSAVSDDAKYNLMKALIQPATEIHCLKGDTNDNSRLLPPNHGPDSALTSRNKDFKSFCTISSSVADINKQTSSLASSLNPLKNNCDSSESYQTWNPHASEIYLKQPLTNTSDYIAMNLKMKGCKHTKKYRHYKYEERNMYCNMARYLNKMVSEERRYQKFEKKETPEREEVKIIIDENSPKTSKIRIVNDRSSVSVVCHSLGRIGSPSGRENNTAANQAESSGGESSGYKSFHNNSNTKNSDMSQQIEIETERKHPTIITRNPKNIYVQYHNPSVRCEASAKLLYNESNAKSSENNFNSLYVDDPVNACAVGEGEDHIENQRNVYSKNHRRQNLEIKYKSYDTKDYLSTFTNRMDVYLPCEITAYQVEERKGSEIYKFNHKERLEKDVDDAELRIGKYLAEKESHSKDELSEDESSEQLDSEDDFETTGDQVIMMKKPDNLEYESQELIVDERLAEPDNLGARTNSTNIPAAPAQHRIVSSPLNMRSNEVVDASDISTNTSHVKFMRNNEYISVTNTQSSNVDMQTNCSNSTIQTLRQKSSKDIIEGSETHMKKESWKNKHEGLDDSNTVRELWANKKSNVDSTDNDSQISGKYYSGKRNEKKHGTNRFKFNIFKKLKSSASEKTVDIPLDQQQPPLSFSENSAPSNSTIFTSTVDSNPSESTIAEESHVSSAPTHRVSSVISPHTDTAAIQEAKRTYTDALTKKNITDSRFQANAFAPTTHKDTETHPEPSIVPLVETLLQRPQGIPPAVPPPASALPPPYPLCCPLAPYMMQYWQNNQQPPPASRVPLPEAEWKPTSSTGGSEPPPPGMVPIPWFPPMMHFNDPRQSIRPNMETPNNLHAQPPPEWSMMPRGYAPCLPCSRTPEIRLRQTDSVSYDGDELALESSEKRQDVKRKKVSNKLFKIFRRRNRADLDTLNEDDKPGKYHRTRPEATSNNVQVVENGEQNLEDRSIWDSPDIAGIVTPEEIGRCFRRGFRADGLTLSGDNYLCTREPSDTTSEHEDVFNFSDHDTPLDFLLALGFSVDEATAAIRDDDVRSRFKAALTEARIWVPHIATTQGTLLYLLAMKAKPKVMRYFLQLVESIVNKRITNAVKLDAYLKILEKVEEGYVSFVTLFGRDSRKDDEEDTVIVEKQRRRIFYTIYKYAEAEALQVDRPLTKADVDLLHSLAIRYRSAIGPHLRLLACYIGEGLLTKDVQLEAALIYLSRLDSADVKLADLEKYCGLPPSERRRLEQIAQTDT